MRHAAAGRRGRAIGATRPALLALQGPASADDPRVLAAPDLARAEALPLRRGPRRRARRARLAHRLHRLRRLRALLRGGRRGRALGRAARGGPRRGPRAGRPRRARHAAARGRPAPLRPRARRRHHAARGGPRPLRRARRRELPRRRGAPAPARRRRSRGASSASSSRSAAIARAGYALAPRRRRGRPRHLGRTLADPRKKRSASATFRPPSLRVGTRARGRDPRTRRSAARGRPDALRRRGAEPRSRRPLEGRAGGRLRDPARACATPARTSGRASRARRVTVGITDYAQQQLGDIVFVELPAVGHARSRRASPSAWSSR